MDREDARPGSGLLASPAPAPEPAGSAHVVEQSCQPAADAAARVADLQNPTNPRGCFSATVLISALSQVIVVDARRSGSSQTEQGLN